MTPDEASRHEWLQPSGSSSYSKAVREQQQHQHQRDQENADLNITKYQRGVMPIKINSVLPEIKTPSSRYKIKSLKAKGRSANSANRRRVSARELETDPSSPLLQD